MSDKVQEHIKYGIHKGGLVSHLAEQHGLADHPEIVTLMSKRRTWRDWGSRRDTPLASWRECKMLNALHCEAHQVPAPRHQALSAWLRLTTVGLPWVAYKVWRVRRNDPYAAQKGSIAN